MHSGRGLQARHMLFPGAMQLPERLDRVSLRSSHLQLQLPSRHLHRPKCVHMQRGMVIAERGRPVQRGAEGPLVPARLLWRRPLWLCLRFRLVSRMCALLICAPASCLGRFCSSSSGRSRISLRCRLILDRTGTNCDQPICRTGCLQGGCTQPGHCDCNAGWTGLLCDTCIVSGFALVGWISPSSVEGVDGV